MAVGSGTMRLHSSVSGRRQAACLGMLFRVLGVRSSLLDPATVTRPGFTECLYW